MLLLSLVAAAHQQNLIINREAYGIIFNPSGYGSINPPKSVLLTVALSIPPVADNICKSLPDTNLTKLASALSNNYHEIRSSLFNQANRRRRAAILPFVGQLSSALFGTATESDIESLNNNLLAIKTSLDSEHVLNVDKDALLVHLTDVVRKLVIQAKATAVIVNHGFIISNKSHHSLRDNIELISSNQKILLCQNYIHDLTYDLNSLVNIAYSVRELREGRVDRFMNMAIFEQNSNKLKSFDINPTKLFQANILNLYARETEISIQLSVPIVVFNVVRYRVHSFAIPLMSNKTGSTLITNVNKYFISNLTHYSLFDNNIRQPQMVFKNATASCIYGIFSNNVAMVHDKCSFRLIPEIAPQKHIVQHNNVHILINFDGTYSLHCPNGSRPVTLNSIANIRVPCNCYIDHQNMTIYNDKAMCNIFDQSFTITRSVNIPIYYALSSQKSLKFDLSDVDLISLHGKLARMSDKLSTMSHRSQKLKHFADELLDKENSSSLNTYWTMPSIMHSFDAISSFSLLASIISVVLSSYTLNRLLTLLAGCAALQAKSVEAIMPTLPVPSFDFRLPTDPTPTSELNTELLKEVIGTVVVSTILTISVVLYICTRGNSNIRPIKTQMYLKLSTRQDEVDIPLGRFPHPLLDVVVNRIPRLGGIDLSTLPPYRVTLIWVEGLAYSIRHHEFNAFLKRRVWVSPWVARKISRILANDNAKCCVYAVDSRRELCLLAADADQGDRYLLE